MYKYPNNKNEKKELVTETLTTKIVYGEKGVSIIEKKLSKEDKLAQEEAERQYLEECASQED